MQDDARLAVAFDHEELRIECARTEIDDDRQQRLGRMLDLGYDFAVQAAEYVAALLDAHKVCRIRA